MKDVGLMQMIAYEIRQLEKEIERKLEAVAKPGG